MTALGQHSMVPPLYANRAKVAPRARTAREAPSLSAYVIALLFTVGQTCRKHQQAARKPPGCTLFSGFQGLPVSP